MMKQRGSSDWDYPSDTLNAGSVVAMYSRENGEARAQVYLREMKLLAELTQNRTDEGRIPPDFRDLARLHAVARARRAFTILEFGVGYSTIVLADALIRNREEWESLPERPHIRNSTPFELHSVDTSTEWIERTAEMLPSRLREIVTFHRSEVCAGTFQDRACHFYKNLPDIVPDFIYLDGPARKAVTGRLSGWSWNCPDRIVTAADILRMEPQLLPGTFILIDGRTANARFLFNHMYRSWDVERSVTGDVTALELREPPLGKVNAEALAYCLSHRVEC